MEFSLALFMFSKGAYYEAATAHFEEGLEIRFRTVEEMLKES